MVRRLPLWCVLIVSLMTRVAQGQTASEGTKVFGRYCAVCHEIQPARNMVGPTLFALWTGMRGLYPGFATLMPTASQV